MMLYRHPSFACLVLLCIALLLFGNDNGPYRNCSRQSNGALCQYSTSSSSSSSAASSLHFMLADAAVLTVRSTSKTQIRSSHLDPAMASVSSNIYGDSDGDDGQLDLSFAHMNIEMPPKSKYLHNSSRYDVACYLIDGVLCECGPSGGGVSSMTWRPSTFRRSSCDVDINSRRTREGGGGGGEGRPASYLSLLLADSQNLRKSMIISSSHYIGDKDKENTNQDKITVVISIVSYDFSRLSTFIFSLVGKPLLNYMIHSLIIITPYESIELAEAFIKELPYKLRFPIYLYKDSDILGVSDRTVSIWKGAEFNIDRHAIKIALNLLVSVYIQTDFYLVLDSAVVVLRDFSFDDIIEQGRAIYNKESRLIQQKHQGLRSHVSTLLNDSNVMYSHRPRENDSPNMYSRYASALVLRFGLMEYEAGLQIWLSNSRGLNNQDDMNIDLDTIDYAFWSEIYSNIDSRQGKIIGTLNRAIRLFRWLSYFGKNSSGAPSYDWSTFDIYSLTLDHLELFDVIHKSETSLTCGSVLSEDQLPWRPLESTLLKQQVDSNSKCFMSVVRTPLPGVSTDSIVAELENYQSKMGLNKLMGVIQSGEFERIEGWCSKEKAAKIASLIRPSDFAVELGVYGGRSLLPICLMTKNRVFGIDAWSAASSLTGLNRQDNEEFWSKVSYDKIYSYTKDLMIRHNCSNVALVRMRSQDAVSMIADESVDFLHQDSNHSEEISSIEVELYWNKVKRGGLWVADDTDWDTTSNAQTLLIKYGYEEVEDYGTWKVYRRRH